MSAEAVLAVRRYMAACAEDGACTLSDPHEPSYWLRSRLCALQERWDSRAGARCGHLVNEHLVGVCALWVPDRTVCVPCAPELSLIGDPDHTCDRCGYVGAAESVPSLVLAGTLLVMLNLCRRCHRKEAGR